MATTTRLPLGSLILALALAAPAASCGGGSGGGGSDTASTVDTVAPGDTGGDGDADTGAGDTAVAGCGIAKPTGASCNPYPGCDTGCASGQVCTNVETVGSEAVACHASDAVPIGGVCDHAAGPFCADGACVAGTCRQFCDTKADCDNGTECRSYQSGSFRVNVCGASSGTICDPFQPDVECGEGTSCYRNVVTAKSSCLSDGTVPFGGACDCAECCEPGLTCTRNSETETGVCGQNCVAGGPADRGCASRCEGLVPWRPLHDANTVAFCVPFESYDVGAVNVGGSSSGELTNVGEYDVYRFSGTAGQVIRVTLSTPGAAFNTDGIDAVVSIHKVTDGKTVAIGDDALFANDFDSDVLTMLPETGSYYILVRDCWTYQGERPDQDFGCYLPIAKTQRSYTIAVGDLSTSVTRDAENGDDEQNPTALAFPRSGGNYAGVVALGTYEDATDVDVYAITVPGDLGISGLAGQSYRAEMVVRGFRGGVTGPYGSGSAAEMGEVRLTTADAPGRIIARLSEVDEDSVLHVPVVRGTDYLLWVTAGNDPAPTGSERDFYFVGAAPDRSFLLERATNDSLETAEEVKEVYTDDTQLVFQFAGDLDPVETDVDYYSFPIANPKRKIDVVCWAASLGSGLQGLTATLYETNGTAIQNGSATDSQSRPAVISGIFPSATATAVILKVSATGGAADTTSRHYECQVVLGVPTPDDGG
ncbi:MAG: hypothetical protein KC635_01625 [Myxococcales bacterium]|nr:hypothetical protein [Myxococcales bacterium]MCB9737327.1 hypothetical protein [Deltaproteobacteria bacterium]